MSGTRKLEIHIGGVEVWRGVLGKVYRLPALSYAGASLTRPCFRFHTPLIEPDVRISRFRRALRTNSSSVEGK